MLNRFTSVMVVTLLAALGGGVAAFAQRGAAPAPGGWVQPIWDEPPITNQNKKPAPKRNIAGTWGPAEGAGAGIQAGGVKSKPNNGKPENALPYTPHGLEVYKTHKGLEGANAVLPTEGNDPRNVCDPLGVPRYNHYNVRLTQIFQDDRKVVILYQYDNRWRTIWTDGRQLPKIVDGGVEIAGGLREQRFFGYSVGKWVDDYTLVAETVGGMPEDRVWLDSTGRPLSDKVHVIETFHRVDRDTLVWSETIDDPVMYTKPWETMVLPMRLKDAGTDVAEYYCSVTELQRYNKFYGYAASGKDGADADSDSKDSNK